MSIPGWEDVDREARRGLAFIWNSTLQTEIKTGVRVLLTAAEYEKILVRSAGRCELSGIRFSSERVNGARTRPFMPTLDRIKATAPYSFDNCRLVCWIVNLALNRWGDEPFWRMVQSAHRRMELTAAE